MGTTHQQAWGENNAPTLQQIMETMLVLQRDNEEVKQQAREFQEEQDHLREKARVDKEESRAKQDRLREEADRARKAMEDTVRMNEELQTTNDEPWRVVHMQVRRGTQVCSTDISARDNPRPFS